MIGRSIRRLLPEDRQEEKDEILARIRAGERVGQFFTKRLHKTGKLLDVSVTVSPVRDKTGRVIGASKIARDVGPYLENQRRLRDSEERFHTLADNIAPFCWMADPDGNIFWYNRRWYDYTGTTLEEVCGWGWTKVHHPDHVERVKKRIQHSWDTGEEWEDTFPLRSKDGEYRWFLSRAVPIRDDEGNIVRWLGTNTDITEQREQAEQIRLLLMEVNHRSKNMLSTVQALARRTDESSPDFLSRFQSRIRSLALNQDILVRREWREVPLDELVHLQLQFVKDAPGTIVVEGEDISLGPRAAEVIGMALHELATNALKYGSLSTRQGKVTIEWQVDREKERFAMQWTESGGPKVTAPERTGFGSRLIYDMPHRFFGGDVLIDYAETGFTWTLASALENLEAGAGTPLN
jgi:PAS domain S-box-containing protein